MVKNVRILNDNINLLAMTLPSRLLVPVLVFVLPFERNGVGKAIHLRLEAFHEYERIKDACSARHTSCIRTL